MTLLICAFAALSQMVFSQEKALVGANKVNVRNLPSVEKSKVLFQLNAGDQITVYGLTGDKSVTNGVLNFWYKISRDQEVWINAEYVYTFPCDFVEQVLNGPGEYGYNRCFIQDFKIENDELYFLIEYDNTVNYYSSKRIIRWEKASSHNWIENRSKNLNFFINYYHDLYNEEYLNENLNSFEQEKDGRWSYYTLKDGSDEIVISDVLSNVFYLFKVILKDKNKTYPYGIKIGMPVDDFIEKMGGFDFINEEYGYLFYNRVNSFQVTVFYENNCVSRIELYCGL